MSKRPLEAPFSTLSLQFISTPPVIQFLGVGLHRETPIVSGHAKRIWGCKVMFLTEWAPSWLPIYPVFPMRGNRCPFFFGAAWAWVVSLWNSRTGTKTQKGILYLAKLSLWNSKTGTKTQKRILYLAKLFKCQGFGTSFQYERAQDIIPSSPSYGIC